MRRHPLVPRIPAKEKTHQPEPHGNFFGLEDACMRNRASRGDVLHFLPVLVFRPSPRHELNNVKLIHATGSDHWSLNSFMPSQ